MQERKQKRLSATSVAAISTKAMGAPTIQNAKSRTPAESQNPRCASAVRRWCAGIQHKAGKSTDAYLRSSDPDEERQGRCLGVDRLRCREVLWEPDVGEAAPA